jgi:hypothetical protein
VQDWNAGLSVDVLPFPHDIRGVFAALIPTDGLLAAGYATLALAGLLLPLAFSAEENFIFIRLVRHGGSSV